MSCPFFFFSFPFLSFSSRSSFHSYDFLFFWESLLVVIFLEGGRIHMDCARPWNYILLRGPLVCPSFYWIGLIVLPCLYGVLCTM
jgi:hypothetical protein